MSAEHAGHAGAAAPPPAAPDAAHPTPPPPAMPMTMPTAPAGHAAPAPATATAPPPAQPWSGTAPLAAAAPLDPMLPPAPRPLAGRARTAAAAAEEAYEAKDYDKLRRGGGPALALEDIAALYLEVAVDRATRELAPYFSHLDTKAWIRRVVNGVVPRLEERERERDGSGARGARDALRRPDLYGPAVLAFTLASALHFALKKHHDDGDLSQRHLGTALMVVFGSLTVGALALDVAWQYLRATTAASSSSSSSLGAAPLDAPDAGGGHGLDRAFCVVGYSLFGPAIVVTIDGRLHWALFYPLAALLAGGSAACLGLQANSGAPGRARVLGVLVALCHLFWVVNLRSMYRLVVPIVSSSAASAAAVGGGMSGVGVGAAAGLGGAGLHVAPAP